MHNCHLISRKKV